MKRKTIIAGLKLTISDLTAALNLLKTGGRGVGAMQLALTDLKALEKAARELED